MSMDLTGITNQNEYYTNHYFSSIFEENASETISAWRAEAKESEEIRTPWALLRDVARQYYPVHDRFLRSKFDTQTLVNIRTLADMYLKALGYPEAKPEWIEIDDTLKAPVYLELTKANGAPALWILLATSDDKEAAILDKYCFAADEVAEEGLYSVPANVLTNIPNEDLVTKILFGQAEPPRFILLIGMNQIALIDRNKWNEKRYLQFELEDIFSRHEESTLQAMAVLLHRNSLCPEDGTALLDELDANSQKHAAGVSQDLKYALRESIEILGNEVLYDMATRQGRNLETDPGDGKMVFFDKDIQTNELDEKSSRKILAHDDDLMVCHLWFKKGGVGSLHQHPHTQIAYILKGKFEFNVEGEKTVVTAGDSIYIPGNAEHGLVCLEEGEVLDIFTPERKDFLGVDDVI